MTRFSFRHSVIIPDRIDMTKPAGSSVSGTSICRQSEQLLPQTAGSDRNNVVCTCPIAYGHVLRDKLFDGSQRNKSPIPLLFEFHE